METSPEKLFILEICPDPYDKLKASYFILKKMKLRVLKIFKQKTSKLQFNLRNNQF